MQPVVFSPLLEKNIVIRHQPSLVQMRACYTFLHALLVLAVKQILYSNADLYMNSPRGSNNKLNEMSDNVRNDNRLFDSQNNAAAGYQVGDKCDGSCSADTNNDNNAAPDKYMSDWPGAGMGTMYYYASSLLHIEWTAQHGCGREDPSNNCEIIIQYMCEDTSPGIRDGTTRETIGGGHNENGGNTQNNAAGFNERQFPSEEKSRDQRYGQHETYGYWMNCKMRERNKGLFTADKLTGTTTQQTAIYTRQGNNGERYGFECPEERDYYPYWHPSPWRDIAVLTDDTSRCEYYQKNSQNVVDKGECVVEKYNCMNEPTCVKQRYNANANQAPYDKPPIPNNRAACEDFSSSYPNQKSTWTMRGKRWTWPPVCRTAPYQRQNHHGNAMDGFPASYEWEIPYDVHEIMNKKCVLRLRYNTSTADFDGWNSYASNNKGLPANPNKDWLGQGYNISGPLQLNINTAQFSRVFEDRSHVFFLKPRPPEIPFYAAIHNFNVRGRRGNIVDVYPAVEYDFVWSRMRSSVFRWDYLHMQWTGSDANQANNAGNGMQTTDRSNFVEIVSMDKNFPKPLFEGEFYETDLLGDTITDDSGSVRKRTIDLWKSMLPDEKTILKLAFLDQTDCANPVELKNRFPNNAQRRANDRRNCAALNRAPAYFDAGLVQLKKTGTFQFMCTRNNAFTNRGQKGRIRIVENWYVVAFVTFICGILTSCCICGKWFIRSLPEMVEENPKGCWARTYFGKRALGKMRKEKEEKQDRKKSFLRKVDSFRGKPHSEEVHVHEDEKKKHTKQVGRCKKWWSYSSKTVKWSVAFAVVNFGFGIYGLIKAAITKPYMPTSYFFAKAGGGMLNFNCSVILVPVMRNILSWLRTTPINELVPLDDNIVFHKIIFVGIMVASTLHIVAHYLTFSDAAFEDPSHTGGSGIISYALFTFEGFTGHVILLIMTMMAVTALECCRRKSHKCCCCWTVGGYTIFWTIHKLWVPCMLLLLLHAKKFWSYVTWPLLLTILEKLIQSYRGKEEIELIEARALPSDVMTIRFRVANGKKFRYKAGQYIYINCPEVSLKEWHPFTLSSAPEDDFLSCHIRCTKNMDWCYPFRKKINPKDAKLLKFDAIQKLSVDKSVTESKNGRSNHRVVPVGRNGVDDVSSKPSAPLIRIDGPYGSASEEVFDYQSLVMVGAGIGVTPFSSIMRSMALRRKQQLAIGGHKAPMPRTHFYWLCRSRWEFDAFRDLMRNDISSQSDLAKSFTFHLYMSGETQISDDSFQRELKEYSRWAELFTGRPKWDRIFQEIRKESFGKEIGVFLCGPPQIAADLKKCSKKYSDDRVANRRDGIKNGTYFVFHQENF